MAPRLLVPDLNLQYPFIDGDSYDWLANALWWSGADVRFSARQPFLPLLLAALERCHLLRLWPVLAFGAAHAAAIALYAALRTSAGRFAAAGAVVTVLAAFSVQHLALDLMADTLAAALATAALAAMLLALGDAAGACPAPKRPRLLVIASGFAGLAAVTQSAGLLLAAPLVLAFVAVRERRVGRTLLAAALFLGPTVAWTLWRRTLPASLPLLNPWDFLRLDAGAPPAFGWFFVSLLGAPAALAMAAAVWRNLFFARGAGRNAGGGPGVVRAHRARIVLLACALPALFFGLFYSYHSKRFALYVAWPATALLADAFAGLKPRARALAVAVVASTAMLPLPERGCEGAVAALWPAPPVFAVTPLRAVVSGSTLVDLRGTKLLRPRSTELGAWYRRAFVPQRPAPRALTVLDAAAVSAAEHAMYFGAPAEKDRRFLDQGQVGNALRKRTQWLAAEVWEPCLQRFALRPAGRLSGDLTVWSLRAPGVAGSWLLARRARDEREDDTGSAPAPFAEQTIRDARAVADAVAGMPRVALIVPREPSPAACLLPPLLHTADIATSRADDAEERRFYDGLATGPGTLIGGMRVRPAIAFGLPAAIVETAPSP